ncbi:hypothetical protein EOM09_00910 [bacterium]|nr:hypothetical protein [bacterium]
MRKIISPFFIILLTLFYINISFALDCPKGKTECDNPCPLYVDENGDEKCDNLIKENTEEINIAYQGVESSIDNDRVNDKEEKFEGPYKFVLFSFGPILIYFLTWILQKKGKIKLITHKRIWNVLLLITFLISGISGLILAFGINYGITIPYIKLIKPHVNFGIAMSIISIIHIFWHLNYYKIIFKKN